MENLAKVLKQIDQPAGHKLLLSIIETLGSKYELSNRRTLERIHRMIHQLFVDILSFYGTNQATPLLSRFGQFLRVMGFTLFDEYMKQLVTSPSFDGVDKPFKKFSARTWSRDASNLNMIADLLPLAAFLFNEEFEWEWGPQIAELERRFASPGHTEISLPQIAPYIWEMVIRNHNEDIDFEYHFDRPTGEVLRFSDFMERRRKGRAATRVYFPEEWESNDPDNRYNVEDDEDSWRFRLFLRHHGIDDAFLEYDWRGFEPSLPLRVRMAKALLRKEFSVHGLPPFSLSFILGLQDGRLDDRTVADLISQMNDPQIMVFRWLLEDGRWRLISEV